MARKKSFSTPFMLSNNWYEAFTTNYEMQHISIEQPSLLWGESMHPGAFSNESVRLLVWSDEGAFCL